MSQKQAMYVVLCTKDSIEETNLVCVRIIGRPCRLRALQRGGSVTIVGA